MSLNISELNTSLAVVGGVSGFILLLYCGGMLYYQNRKSKQLETLRNDMAELKGMVLMLRPGKR